MYFGRSVTIVKKPQSWPICAATRAKSGGDVKICFQGIDCASFELLANKIVLKSFILDVKETHPFLFPKSSFPYRRWRGEFRGWSSRVVSIGWTTRFRKLQKRRKLKTSRSLLILKSRWLCCLQLYLKKRENVKLHVWCWCLHFFTHLPSSINQGTNFSSFL